MNRFPWVWACISVVLFVAPAPIYFLVVFPYAETTRDPDAIEGVAWFGGILVMFVGVCCGLITLALALRQRNEQSNMPGIMSRD